MTSSNPYVVAPAETTATSGAGLIDDVVTLAGDIKSENWVSASLVGVAGAVDVAATVSDPFGSLLSAGLGWLMDHFEPIKGWLNDLTGDGDAVAAFAGTYTNIASGLHDESTYLRRKVSADLDGATAEFLTEYRAFMRTYGRSVDALGDAADACATGLTIAAGIVSAVHGIVRDAIATIVGSIVSYAAELVLTLGTATPLVIEQVTTRVSAMATKLGTQITDLIRSVKSLRDLIGRLDEWWDPFGSC